MVTSNTSKLFGVIAVVAALGAGSVRADMPVSGHVRYYATEQGVPDVTVDIRGPVDMQTETANDGSYAVGVTEDGGWAIEPHKSGAEGGAVSALDAAYALQAAVHLRTLDERQMLACDVTGDGKVTALDAARILQYRIGWITQLPAAERCGSQWLFVPASGGSPPTTDETCQPGRIDVSPGAGSADSSDFQAVLLGDCTGNWHAAVQSAPTDTPTATPSDTPTPTPTPSDTVSATPSETHTETPTPSATPTATASSTAQPTSTPTSVPAGTNTRTPTRTPTHTSSATPSRTPTRTPTITPTRTPTRTPTVSPTRTFTPSATPTATITPTRTHTFTRTTTPTATPTRTSTQTRTFTPTFTWTATRTFTATKTLPATNTPTATPTATCGGTLGWGVSAAHPVSTQSGGTVWLTETVPTDYGWGIFWLRQDPGATNIARIYYAHVDFNGQLTHGPMKVIEAPYIAFRYHYYSAAWNAGHYGITVANLGTLYYYNMTLEGVVSGQRAVGPPLFTSSVYDQEADGDLDAYPGGFLGVVEGECEGHSCSYFFKLDTQGAPTGPPTNIVDFDFTHQFYPVSAFDGSGFAILSVKDIQIFSGGPMTKYLTLPGSVDSHIKVVPSKEYQWDEFPDLAWNGNHFAALWTENSGRDWNTPWNIHFATFRRSKNTGSPISDRVLDQGEKTFHKWSTQVHAVGDDWVAQYASRLPDDSLVAVYELVDSASQSHASTTPFALNADALGSSVHYLAGHDHTVGIARGYQNTSSTDVSFYLLDPPVCAH